MKVNEKQTLFYGEKKPIGKVHVYITAATNSLFESQSVYKQTYVQIVENLDSRLENISLDEFNYASKTIAMH